jgi:Helix-turn-helix domain
MLATVATLLGEPARTRILTALLTGRALTAKELAYFAGVTAATASSHLSRLLAGRLLAMEKHSSRGSVSIFGRRAAPGDITAAAASTGPSDATTSPAPWARPWRRRSWHGVWSRAFPTAGLCPSRRSVGKRSRRSA